MSLDPSIVRRHFKYLFMGYNASFVTQRLAMPWWAREPGRYIIAYLPGKPKKMVPVAPHEEEEDTEGRP